MIKVYNQNMQPVAYLENAFGIGYETPFNNLWTASFSLPANDEKNAECLPLRFIELFDGDDRIDLFRIVPSAVRRSADGQVITYQCEHVLATLMDDVLFQFHTIGNLGVHTSAVINYVLQAQEVTRWRIGTINFARQFEYNWENENLLSALFSIPKPFVEEYQWTWDTSSYPWTLNLVEPPTGVQAYIRYGSNMRGITKTIDPLNICTRLYCLGYGEGVNQLQISEVNGGVPYLNADTQGEYGIISKVWTDRRFTSADTLKARGQALLDELKTPRITYEVDASDLSAITNDPIDKFITGTQVRVIDEELGIDVITRVVNVRKSDMIGAPGDVQLEIANRPIDIAGSISELADRQRINDTYSQGATNVNIYNLAENCDPTHPAILRIWVPDEAVRINKVLLTYFNESFRANSKAIEAAPSTSSGPSSTTTTEAGGGQTSSPGHWTLLPPQQLPGDFMNPAGSDNHVHSMFSVSHVHNTDVHSHGMDHFHELPSHTHGMQFGIYEGPRATAIGLLVDGNVVGGAGVSETNIDLVDYLALDDSGKIKRGQWHTIEIVPNTLSRIVANVVIQFFVNSRGGGDY